MGRIRLSPADRVKYPGGDDDGWIEFDMRRLVEQDAGWLEVFEETTGLTVSEFLTGVEKGSARPMRALLWAARKLNGCNDPWDAFRPQIILVDSEGVFDGTDVDPPANRAARRAAAKSAPAKAATRSRARVSKP